MGEKVSNCVWEERGGKGTSGMASEVCSIRACVKLDCQMTWIIWISNNASQRREKPSTVNTLPVMEDGVSTCLLF